MSKSDSIAQIEKITSNFETFKGQNNKLMDQLNELVSNLSSINYSSIEHETTISLIESSLSNKIGPNIDSVAEKCSETVSTAANDANKKMEDIANAYNNSITEEFEDQTKITFNKVDGTLNAVTSLASKGSNNRKGNNKGNNNGNNNGNSDGNYDLPPDDTQEPSVTETLNYYFAHASQDKLNSSEIEGWDDYIKEFLEENELSEYVESITIVDGVIICKLSNGKEYKYENVTGIVDLLTQLKESLAKESTEDEQ